MPSEQPYNSLGQILVGRGEMAVARLIDRGLTGRNLNRAVESRFPGINETVRDELINYSRSIVMAGDSLNASFAGGVIDLDDIPINQFLWGDGPQQGRAKVGFEIELPWLDKRLSYVFTLPDLDDPSELYGAIFQYLNDLIKDSPEAFGLERARNVPTGTQLRFIFAERSF